jgi:hypothetical protein
MTFTFARIGAVVTMGFEDCYPISRGLTKAMKLDEYRELSFGV